MVSSNPYQLPVPSGSLDSTVTLESRIESLPQELQDEILRFTILAMRPARVRLVNNEATPSSHRSHGGCTAIIPRFHLQATHQDDECGVVYIDQNYKPSTALQINRKIRRDFAKMLYWDMVLCYDLSALAKWRQWYRSLSLEHYDMLRIIPLRPMMVFHPFVLADKPTRLFARRFRESDGVVVTVKASRDSRGMKDEDA